MQVKEEAKTEIEKYETRIKELKAEVDKYRHLVATQSHNALLFKIQENQKHQETKQDKITKEIHGHFQQEKILKKEIFDLEKTIFALNNKHEETKFSIYKIKLSQQNKKRDKIKDLTSQNTKINIQIQTNQDLLDKKLKQYEDLIKKRETFETYFKKAGNTPQIDSLRYLYEYYLLQIENISNEQERISNMIELNKRELKIHKIIEQLKIRDEYITKENNELKHKKVKFQFNNDNKIKPLSQLKLINKKQITPLYLYQDLPPINTLSTSHIEPKTKWNNNNNNNFQRTISARFNNVDYSGYTNPNVIKEKKVFNTKTNQVISYISGRKKSKISTLRLNIINDRFKGSKVLYVNKPLSINDYHNNNVISFQPKLLNKSNSSISIKSNESKHNNVSDPVNTSSHQGKGGLHSIKNK